MSLPTPADLPRIADILERVAATIRTDAAPALRATHLADQPERVETVPTSSSGASSPTEGAALVDTWLLRQQLAVRRDLGALLDLAVAIESGLAIIGRRIYVDPGPDPHLEDGTQCAELYCADPPTPGRAGRCDPCRKWRARHPDHDGPIPRTVIDDRVALRENRRVHVTGPLAAAG